MNPTQEMVDAEILSQLYSMTNPAKKNPPRKLIEYPDTDFPEGTDELNGTCC